MIEHSNPHKRGDDRRHPYQRDGEVPAAPSTGNNAAEDEAPSSSTKERTTKYYRITKDTPNPLHDKRCKYGIESIPVFKQGEVIVAWSVSDTVCGVHIERHCYQIRGRYLDEAGKTFKAIPCELCEPSDEEIFMANYKNASGVEFVATMIREGKLKLADVEEYYNREE
jgi:hypothetical protein